MRIKLWPSWGYQGGTGVCSPGKKNKKSSNLVHFIDHVSHYIIPIIYPPPHHQKILNRISTIQKNGPGEGEKKVILVKTKKNPMPEKLFESSSGTTLIFKKRLDNFLSHPQPIVYEFNNLNQLCGYKLLLVLCSISYYL